MLVMAVLTASVLLLLLLMPSAMALQMASPMLLNFSALFAPMPKKPVPDTPKAVLMASPTAVNTLVAPVEKVLSVTPESPSLMPLASPSP